MEARRVDIDARDVGPDGVVEISGGMDLADALDLDTALDHGAAELKALGCDETHDVRRSLALGALARTQTQLDLNPEDPDGQAGPLVKPRQTVIHVHTHDQTQARCETTRTPISVESSVADRLRMVNVRNGWQCVGMPLTFVGNLDRSAVSAAVDQILDLVRSAEVAAAWEQESALPGMTVGGLARHLASQAECAVKFLTTPGPPNAPVLSLVGHYDRVDWWQAPVDAAENTSIRDDFNQMGLAGHAECVKVLARSREDLGPAIDAAGLVTYVPWQDCALPTDTRLLLPSRLRPPGSCCGKTSRVDVPEGARRAGSTYLRGQGEPGRRFLRVVGMELSAEDQKLVTLARATRARTGAAEGAAVRDSDGRTYAGATVSLPSLELSAVQVCVAMAVASGSQGLAAAVVLGDATELAAPDQAVLGEFGAGDVVVHLSDSQGRILQ